jgi:uncharacterized repeat protein (TIGR03806 family)
MSIMVRGAQFVASVRRIDLESSAIVALLRLAGGCVVTGCYKVANNLSVSVWLTILVAASLLLLSACGGGGGGGSDLTSAVSGLDSRPDNPACVAPPLAAGTGAYAAEDAFPAAPDFNFPVKLLQAPGDPDRWFVLEKPGQVRVFSVTDPANVATFLDVDDGANDNVTGGTSYGDERGLLGMAFHPNFPTVPEVYIYYTGGGGSLESRVSRFILDNTDQPTNYMEEVLLRIRQPAGNHNGGEIAFDTDGHLYIGLGDGGGSNDPNNNGQNTATLLGSMLRIDVLGVAFPTPGYNIPADNPFRLNGATPNAMCGIAESGQDCPEIYAWGLRNPWRWSFDPPTGDLWLGDVGQGAWEEVDKIVLGGNYGWDCREGLVAGPGACSIPGTIDPITVYGRSLGQSITGGYVYRGTNIPSLNGRYVFADYVSGRIWALADNGSGGYTNEQLLDMPFNLSAFALGEDDELYVLRYGASGSSTPGKIYRLADNTPGTVPIPDDLAATGCANPDALIPYDINALFWTDGAVKNRAIGLPAGQTVSINGEDDWDFPIGTVLVKSFELDNKLIETRLFMLHPNSGAGEWRGYTYEWNDAETAATKVTGGKTRDVNGQDWIYPTEGECMQCHTAAAGFALGPETAQMNRNYAYPSTGITANQLATLDHIVFFDAPLPGPPSGLPVLPDPFDPATGTLEERARAYLHTNCAQCHNDQSLTTSAMDLGYTQTLGQTSTCDVDPQLGDMGLTDARIIKPGDPDNSVLIYRMNRRDSSAMPPVGSTVVDQPGVALLRSWVSSLGGC